MRKRRNPKKNKGGNILRKLRLTEGDVLLIEKDSQLATKEMIDQMAVEFEKRYKFPILMIVVDDLDSIRVADEETMNKAGWVRWPRGKKNE